MDYERALLAIAEGKAIIFVGAGFSIGATSLDDGDFPTGTKLAEVLCNTAKAPNTPDLKTASGRYLRVKDPDDLIRFLREKFTVKSICEYHSIISAMPWKGIYTTNYDNVLETGAKEKGKKLVPLTLSDDPRLYRSSSETVLHINGYIDRLNKETLQTEFKLTNTSYLTTQFRESNWSEVFIRQIQSAQAIFFVGYSLYDLDIQEVLFADRDLKEKTFFVQRAGMSDEDLKFSELSDFGTILSIGVDRFAEDIININPDAISKDSPLVLVGFEEMLPVADKKHLTTSEDIFALLLRGEVNNLLVAEQALSGSRNDYIFNRDVQSFSLGGIRNFVFVGDLGNGKTTLMRAICADYLKRGYNVFWLKDQAYDNFDELEELLNSDSPAVIVFDNYTRKMDLVAHANLKRKENTILMLSARTSLHKSQEESLFFKDIRIDLKTTLEVDCNKLSLGEIENLSTYFSRYGLWGEKASFHSEKKIRYLKHRCNSELHAVLLDLLASPEIQSRFSSFFKEINNSRSFTQTMIAAFALNLLNITEPSAHMVAAITNDSSIFNPSFKSNPAIKQFFNNERGIISPKSSALAEFALKNFPDPVLLVDMLVNICRATRKKAEVTQFYWDLYRDLASFSNIQRMLPDKSQKQLLIQFYEGLRKIDLERDNPLFWLQYAMARMNFPDVENLEQAEKYLTTALSIGRARKNYTIVDIETQYARYHLEYAIHIAATADVAYRSFITASDFFSKITKIEIYKIEPFRPIKNYLPFFKKFQKNFSALQLHRILEACNIVLHNIKLLPTRTSDDRHVKEAKSCLQEIIGTVMHALESFASPSSRPKDDTKRKK